MSSLSKKQSILSRETINYAFFLELCPYFDLDFLSSIKHPAAERWHPHAVRLFVLMVSCLIEKIVVISFTFEMSSANALNLDNS